MTNFKKKFTTEHEHINIQYISSVHFIFLFSLDSFLSFHESFLIISYQLKDAWIRQNFFDLVIKTLRFRFKNIANGIQRGQRFFLEYLGRRVVRSQICIFTKTEESFQKFHRQRMQLCGWKCMLIIAPTCVKTNCDFTDYELTILEHCEQKNKNALKMIQASWTR